MKKVALLSLLTLSSGLFSHDLAIQQGVSVMRQTQNTGYRSPVNQQELNPGRPSIVTLEELRRTFRRSRRAITQATQPDQAPTQVRPEPSTATD